VHDSELGAERRRSRGSIAQARVPGRDVAARAKIGYRLSVLRFNTLFIALCLVAATFGCKKGEKKPPPAPGGSSFQGGGIAGPTDAGPEDSGGPIDAGITIDASTISGECTNVDPGDYVAANGGIASDGTVLTGATAPSDFTITRAVATWETSCIDPTILIELSDGKCPGGKQHKLQILLSADAIDGATPTILVGQNTLQADPVENNGIRVQYVRPNSLDPHGTWGSCAGMPGTIDFLSEPATTRLSHLSGRFALDLAACDGSEKTNQFVSGTFNVVLRRSREDVCPSK
jgi:hypothetical protein